MPQACLAGKTDNMVHSTIPSLRDAVAFSRKFSVRIWKKRSRERSESEAKGRWGSIAEWR